MNYLFLTNKQEKVPRYNGRRDGQSTLKRLLRAFQVLHISNAQTINEESRDLSTIYS